MATMKKYAMGGSMTTTTDKTTKKPGKYKNLGGEIGNPPFDRNSPVLPLPGRPAQNMPKVKAKVKVVKKAKSGAKFDLNKDGKTTFKDVLIGRGVLSKNAKSGTKMKKAQYGSAIMGTVGRMMNDMQQLKKEKMNRKKAETSPAPTSKRPDSNMSTPYSTSSVNPATLAKSGKTMKKVKAKSGASVKKCKGGC
jgi:hypothetical protein